MKKSPSKFGKGIGLLWRGMSLKIASKFLLNTVKRKKLEKIKDNNNILLFESARSALFNCLMSQNIGKGDEVIISSFTCDAVTYAVKRTGAKVVYSDINDDLTMQTESVLRAITKSTKAIVMQNTLGRVGLDISTIAVIKKKNILLIEDCALSYGSVFNGIKLGAYGDFSFFSLEVSKTITIGWGGVLSINNFSYKTEMLKRYALVGSVSQIQDTRRFFQLYLSLFLIKMKPYGGVWLWYFLYGFRIFRRSNRYNLNMNCESEKMGNLSKSFYYYVCSKFDAIYRITNRNYISFSSAARKLGLVQTIVEKPSEFIVSPRFSLTLKPKNVKFAVALGESMNIEVGRWFSNSPPSWEVKNTRVESSVNASRISDSIINIPCHWTLSKNEISEIKKFLYELSLIER
jgi:perosamine synthetase